MSSWDSPLSSSLSISDEVVSTPGHRGRTHAPDPKQQEPHTPRAWLRIGSSALRTNGMPEALGTISGQGQVFLSAVLGAERSKFCSGCHHRGTIRRLRPKNNTVETRTKTTVTNEAQETSFEPWIQLDLNMAFLPLDFSIMLVGLFVTCNRNAPPPHLVHPSCQHRWTMTGVMTKEESIDVVKETFTLA